MREHSEFPGGTMQSLNELEPSDDDLRGIEQDMKELDDELAASLDAKRSALPPKTKRRDRPTFGIQRLDTLYKDPANWQPWANVTLVHQAREPNTAPFAVGVDTILGFFISYRHVSVLGARKLIRGSDPLLGQEIEYVTDPWYLHNSEEKYRSEPSTDIHFVTMLHIVLDDGIESDGEHLVQVNATRGVGIKRVCLDTAIRLSGPRTILYLPAGLDILDGLAKECKLKIKEAFDAHS